MDFEHARLFDLLNQLAARSAGLGPLLDGFRRYADQHFLVEEALMEAHAYPGLAEHAAAHAAYRARFAGLAADALEDSPVVLRAMQAWLERWWVDHVGGVDATLAGYLRQQGLASPELVTVPSRGDRDRYEPDTPSPGIAPSVPAP